MGRPFFGILFIHIDPTDGQFVQVIIELLTGIDKNASSIYQRENDGFNKFFIGLYGTEVDVVTQYFFFFVRFFLAAFFTKVVVIPCTVVGVLRAHTVPSKFRHETNV